MPFPPCLAIYFLLPPPNAEPRPWLMAFVICFCTSLATALVAACVAACCSWLPIDPIASWIPPTACCAPGCGRGRWLQAGGHGDQRDGVVGRSGWEETDRQKDRESRRESARGRQKGRKEGARWEREGMAVGRSGRGMRLREKERDEINNELAPSEIRRSRVVSCGREGVRRDPGCGFRGGGMTGREIKGE